MWITRLFMVPWGSGWLLYWWPGWQHHLHRRGTSVHNRLLSLIKRTAWAKHGRNGWKALRENFGTTKIQSPSTKSDAIIIYGGKEITRLKKSLRNPKSWRVFETTNEAERPFYSQEEETSCSLLALEDEATGGWNYWCVCSEITGKGKGIWVWRYIRWKGTRAHYPDWRQDMGPYKVSHRSEADISKQMQDMESGQHTTDNFR